MFLWFVGLAPAIVWNVFRDGRIDYRLVALGALLPDLVDLPAGRPHLAHTVVAPVAALTAVMLATRGRRTVRRQLLALPIGWFLHLILDATWAEPDVFGWPFLGRGFPDGRFWPIPAVGVLLEVAGGWVIAWFAWRFRLSEPDRRARFLSSGQVST